MGKKINLKKQRIDIQIYKCSVIFGGYQELGRLDLTRSNERGRISGSVWSEGGDVYFAFSNEMGGSILAHEVVHIANVIFTMKGIESSVQNDEHQAYLVEYIYHELCNKIFFYKGEKNGKTQSRKENVKGRKTKRIKTK